MDTRAHCSCMLRPPLQPNPLSGTGAAWGPRTIPGRSEGAPPPPFLSTFSLSHYVSISLLPAAELRHGACSAACVCACMYTVQALLLPSRLPSSPCKLAHDEGLPISADSRRPASLGSVRRRNMHVSIPLLSQLSVHATPRTHTRTHSHEQQAGRRGGPHGHASATPPSSPSQRTTCRGCLAGWQCPLRARCTDLAPSLSMCLLLPRAPRRSPNGGSGCATAPEPEPRPPPASRPAQRRFRLHPSRWVAPAG